VSGFQVCLNDREIPTRLVPCFRTHTRNRVNVRAAAVHNNYNTDNKTHRVRYSFTTGFAVARRVRRPRPDREIRDIRQNCPPTPPPPWKRMRFTRYERYCFP